GSGPGRGPGPRRPGQPQPAPAGQEAVATAEGAAPPAKPGAQPPRPAPPPRRPRREPPKPKLSQAAFEGKAPLRTFAELSALLAAKQTPRPAPVVQIAEVPAEPVAATAQEAPAPKTEAAEGVPPA